MDFINRKDSIPSFISFLLRRPRNVKHLSVWCYRCLTRRTADLFCRYCIKTSRLVCNIFDYSFRFNLSTQYNYTYNLPVYYGIKKITSLIIVFIWLIIIIIHNFVNMEDKYPFPNSLFFFFFFISFIEPVYWSCKCASARNTSWKMTFTKHTSFQVFRFIPIEFDRYIYWLWKEKKKRKKETKNKMLRY